MKKFRKKPVVIEAIQWNGDTQDDVMVIKQKLNNDLIGIDFEGRLMIPTLEGLMRAEKGDWIIRGIKGEIYPCKPDIFEKTYEPVDKDDKK